MVSPEDRKIMSYLEQVVEPTLLSRGVGDELCGEIIQQTAIRLWNTGHWSLSTKRGFISTVALNLLRDHQRQRRLEPLSRYPEDHNQLADCRGDPASVLADTTGDLARQYCTKVPGAAEILDLTLHGARSSEIAARLHVPAGTVRRRLHEIRLRLRPVLA
jgi:DNA-directed RNA polymerase specialized sigma24 family protein